MNEDVSPSGHSPSNPVTRDQWRESLRAHGFISPFKEDSLMYRLGGSIGDFFTGPNAFNRSFDHGAGAGGIMGALALGVPAYLGSKAVNWLRGDESLDAGANALRFGLVGGALGAGRGYNQTQAHGGDLSKSRYAIKQSSLFSLMSEIQQADIPADIRLRLLGILNQLSPSEQSQVASILRTATGATLGALLGRFLMGRGISSILGGGLAGGLLTNMFSPAKTYSSYNDIFA